MRLISIVTPIYNRAYCLPDMVRSVIDQTYTNWELVIVDDGSDDSREVIRILQSFDDERIKYKRFEHTGNISKVRNRGCAMADGEIIVVHDSDDMAFPNRLEEIEKAFTEGVDVVYHGMYIRSLDDIHNATTRLHKPSQPFNKDRLLKEQYIPGQIAFTKDVWEEVKYDEDFPLMDDWVFLIDLVMADKKFKQIDKELYEYVSLNDSVNIQGEADGRRKQDTVNLIKKLKDRYGITATADMFKHTETYKTNEVIK